MVGSSVGVCCWTSTISTDGIIPPPKRESESVVLRDRWHAVPLSHNLPDPEPSSHQLLGGWKRHDSSRTELISYIMPPCHPHPPVGMNFKSFLEPIDDIPVPKRLKCPSDLRGGLANPPTSRNESDLR
ncbi:hypothetical protein TNIN_79181 [Trichonephila inaurata madagascariensis]|uniref:Uncharacterized protein n=1 Tax=Trichonephila inaurata madagascariensis TaxID=2747483 RepID=A0A8X6XG01_9ARAC|nr:hypothetical protein TNIN_79181 [Trichonephila inaurata madagascariensis]